jgi:hypothetical protein
MSNISQLAEKLPSISKLKSYEARLAPAGERTTAAELTRLVTIFRLDPKQWANMSKHYVEALTHLPADLLHDAISELIGSARSGDYFPRPGDIAERCQDAIAQRRVLLDHARAEVEDWPRWLEEVWGPLPEGRIKRNNAAKAQTTHAGRPTTPKPPAERALPG